jgi:hypothetical protein
VIGGYTPPEGSRMYFDVGIGSEIGFGQDFMGRPMPWSSDPGTAKKPRYSWDEYLLAKGPIPLQRPIRYVYDQLRKGVPVPWMRWR